ncbi:MAG TPA: hypothetical protein VJR29_07275 [bacterium]|nr:hypothetical protein [bacterium]
MAFQARQTVDVLVVGEALARSGAPLLQELGCSFETVPDRAAAEKWLVEKSVAILAAEDSLLEAIVAAADRDYPLHFMAGSPLDREDLKITVGKLQSGKIFGLELYGIPVREKIELKGGESRYPAVDRVKAFFLEQGVAGRIVDKVEQALHELIMNAGPAVELAYGIGPDSLAISASDPRGDLDRATLFTAIRRAALEKSVVEEPGRGAGLGLLLSLKACGRLIFNVSPGRQTEAIAIFHRAKSLGEAAKMGHSFHYFQESNHEPKTEH